MTNNPVIKFNGYEIVEISLQKEEGIKEREDSVEFEVQKQIKLDRSHAIVKLIIRVEYDSNKSLKVAIQGSFTPKNNLEGNEFDEFLSINGVSILLPYLRSIISMITALDSSESVLIPTINVAELYNKDNID